MTTYPVHYRVEHPETFTRVQLAVRIVAFIAVGMLGISFGTVFFVAYLGLPVFAVSRLATGKSPEAYVEEDGHGILRVLHWLAAISAWAGLVADRLPSRAPEEVVQLAIDPEAAPRPTTRSAIWRVITGLPSALAFVVLCWIGLFVWLWAALSVLLWQRVGDHAFNYLVGLQRWSIRLLVHQASLVEEYPPFSFEDTPPSTVARAHAAS